MTTKLKNQKYLLKLLYIYICMYVYTSNTKSESNMVLQIGTK